MIFVWLTIVFTILSAFFYRCGGISKAEGAIKYPWCPIWLFNGKTRDVGCSLLAIAWMLVCYEMSVWWAYVISFGVCWGALTTYWDWLFGEDNFFAHGFGIALAFLPFAIVSGLWVGFVIRLVVLPLAMGFWCLLFGNDDVEEYGRGALIISTLPLMLI